MVKIEVHKSIADVRITGDLPDICREMIVGVSAIYNGLATTKGQEEADEFRKEFVRMLLSVDAIWEDPDEMIVIDKSKMNGAPTDQS